MIVAGVTARPMSCPGVRTAATATGPSDIPPAFAAVEAAETIATGAADVARGSIGITFCISHDEIEVDFYEPRHVIVFADPSQLQVK